ncbi:Hypothetical predicted protein [Paramuricea clavata]|uniref:Uncharacterized protein n=1 Tax=Paramuricea clavata TaxID=317549 RepID=A0A6S7IMN3_PARCT|nr:Hypothetical predicted protein [Paramuricea clavata]
MELFKLMATEQFDPVQQPTHNAMDSEDLGEFDKRIQALAFRSLSTEILFTSRNQHWRLNRLLDWYYNDYLYKAIRYVLYHESYTLGIFTAFYKIILVDISNSGGDNREVENGVQYQVKNIHGLPVVVHTRRTNDFLLYTEVWEFLRNEFIESADLVAYKGGTIERNLLRRLGAKGINIEILGCDKYVNLLAKYGILPVRCQYHNPGDYHCSRHEVEVFALF